MSTRSVTIALALLAIGGATAPSAPAQTPARTVSLALQPRVGDTIRTRLEQRVEMVSRRADKAGEGEPVRSAMGTVAVLRNIVVSTDAVATTLVIILDSIALDAAGMPRPTDEQRRRLQGQTTRVRLARDGAMTMLDSDGVSVGGAAIGSIPATLPLTAVALGERWTRTLSIPLANRGGAPIRVDAIFRLDSVARGGELAFVSMKGTIRGDTVVSRAAVVQRVVSGAVRGAMVVDRRRGWITDSRTVIDVHTVVLRSDAPPGPPVTIDVKVVQVLRAIAAP